MLRHMTLRFPWHREGALENGYAERLIRTLKEEEVHLNDYKDVIEARDRIGHFITQVYHQKRPHPCFFKALVMRWLSMLG